ncbi:MAG: metal-dependent transcriptional regulator [Ardenticatenaceae bacterium]|nr:metal-dependent transcriptional regulator [Ardenticatenaceae bacterium]MCB9445689.1 metal-dependent transcriptional regulator [Ardenticatenaceae bacterium]
MVDPLIALGTAVLIIIILAILFWPERGLVARWRETGRLNERVRSEDALKHIHKFEMKGRRPTMESIAGALHISQNDAATLVAAMQSNGLLQTGKGEIHLTPQGRDSALHIIRAHRLWERYLAEETGLREAEWHGQAEMAEHQLTPAQADALALQLGNPTHDPHGDPIPTADGELVTHGGQPLSSLPMDTPGLIVHLEDEPEVVYAQLAAEGLHPGMVVRITESVPERVRFWTNGDEHIIAPIVAENISVVPLPEEDIEEVDDCERLTCLKPGQSAEVVGITRACRGPERRRFMDLGILPGTKIKAEMRSPGGDPTAYIIRGALIALRQEQANLIKVKRIEAAA